MFLIESVRNEYEKMGVENYYVLHSKDYRNPHEIAIHKLLNLVESKGYIGKFVLDLCCGSGEVTECLKNHNHIIRGLDPFTCEAYKIRTGKDVLKLSFKDIVQGKLNEKFDTVICSFALHLCDKSMLSVLLWQLSRISKTLIVITPHKRPNCDEMGWFLMSEYIVDRVRLRIYKHLY